MTDYISLIIPSFIAGLLTFLAPCTLPLVPGYLGFVSGVSQADLRDPEKAAKFKKKVFLNGLFFIIGFTLIFIILGTAAGAVGRLFAAYRIWLARIGGIFVIFFGLFMLNVIKIPALAQEKQFRIPPIFERGKPLNSLILGSAFAFGWTPCVGPVLGSILFLISAQATIAQGALLLFVFSLGLAIPFLVIAATIGSAAKYLNRVSKYLYVVSFIGGLFLIFLGVLLITNRLGIWVSFFYRIFDFINYDRLLDYL